MIVDKFSKAVIVTATRGTYLKLKEVENSEELIGKPERIILSVEGKIPDFIEAQLDGIPVKESEEDKAEEKSVKKTRKTTKKK